MRGEQERSGHRVIATPWAQPAEQVAGRLDVSIEDGLSPRQVAERIRRHGPNTLREARVTPWWEILLRQFRSLIVALLAVASVASFAFGDWHEGLAIALVIAINAAIGLFTELRAVRSMEALRQLTRVQTKIRRGGGLTEIPAEGVVPGDIVVLEAGDLIAADLRVLSASKLQTDESALTGESLPVSKSPAPTPEETPLAERTGMLFKGTTVTRGSGEGVVVATGMTSELGQIASLVEGAEEEATPLERRLDRLGRMLLWITLLVAAAIAGVGIAGGRGLLLMIETSIALAVAAIPEGLPIVATLALARGMWRMARRNVVIRRLSAVETLGAASVICTDKTGTLTENRMAVDRYVLESGSVSFAQDDRRVDPTVLDQGGAILRRALEVGALCNNAELRGETGAGVGDPLEVALLEAAGQGGLDVVALRERHPEVREEAFDPDSKRMATVHRTPEGAVLVAAKGAPEAILEVCASVLGPDGPIPLDEAARADWLEQQSSLAARGLRLLGLAYKRIDDENAPAYADLILVGCVALADPPRRDVREAIARCRRAGINVVMVTGDQPETGRTIGEAVGLISEQPSEAVHGSELDRLDALSEAQRQRLLSTSVFARVTPTQKLELISLFQADGRIVAMTGDGVNDAPALKKADIGVAMGRRGTQVAQEAADMVLKDDTFGSIVEAIAQGRAIFDNIRKFVVYLLSCNVSEVLAVAAASFAGLPLPLLPLQILFLNLVTDVFPALALGAGEGAPGIMHRPPRPAREPIIALRHWALIGGFGGGIAAVVLAALLIAIEPLGLSSTQGTTVAFLTLAFAQLWHVFNMRSPDSGLLRNEITRNPYVWGALVLCTGLLLAAVYLPGLSAVLKTADPTPRGWALAIAGSFVPLLVGQTALLLTRRRS
jgi:Ca2+-transporting ATPase